MRRFYCLCLCALGLLTATAHAQTYSYPLTNPFEATIATTPSPLQPSVPDDQDIIQKDHFLAIDPKREQLLPKSFWPVNRFGYRLAQQNGPAPLMFIIAGTGSHYSNGTSEFLKKLFYGAGMHVVQLSSPTSYDFIAAASQSATPGITPDDAADLYRVMQAIMSQHASLEVTRYHLTGYSLGGLQAAFISYQDHAQKAFNFDRVLLLNPPVNLLTSVSILDRLVQAQVEGVNDNTTFYDLIMNKLTRYFNEKGYIDLNEAVLFDFQQSKQKLSDEQLAMLIGAAFRFAAADIAFTSDLINRRGLIIPPNFPITDGTSLTPFFKRALQCDFECYLHDQLLPFWQAQHPDASLGAMVNAISLYPLQEFLATQDNILVMHNADDFILGPGDLAFLRKTLGTKLKVFPYGGHCGNLNFVPNTQIMLEFLQ